MSAREITAALGGRWLGTRGMACCCVHDDCRPSLSIKDGDAPGRILLYCYAGCSFVDVAAALRRRGILGKHVDAGADWRPSKPRSVVHKPDPAALEIWRGGQMASGTIVEAYLKSRGLTIEPPASIRCGSKLHLDRYPMATMIAAIQAPDGSVIATQTTLLTGAGQKALVAVPRLTTGALGLGAVRFGKASTVLGLAEGVETALAAMQLSGIPTWAALGAKRLHQVEIPQQVAELHIFADDDNPGRAAANRAKDRHTRAGCRVVIRFPPKNCGDWNDALQSFGA